MRFLDFHSPSVFSLQTTTAFGFQSAPDESEQQELQAPVMSLTSTVLQTGSNLRANKGGHQDADDPMHWPHHRMQMQSQKLLCKGHSNLSCAVYENGHITHCSFNNFYLKYSSK